MILKYIVFFIVLFIWIFMIQTFSDLKMLAFRFYTGAVGLFLIAIFFFRVPMEHITKYSLFTSLSYISKYTHLFTFKNNLIYISAMGHNQLTINVNNQDVGMITMLVFTALIVFFPYISLSRRVLYFLGGNIAIIFINVFRIVLITELTKIFGVSSYDFDYMILSRIVFFIMIMILYYFAFTKTQIRNQRVGEIL